MKHWSYVLVSIAFLSPDVTL
jgi:histone acetyltransferase 1